MCERVAISWCLVGTACGLKREKKKKEGDSDRGQEGKREREKGRERERRCEDEEKMKRRCEEEM